VAALAVRAFASGGVRRLLLTTVAGIAGLILLGVLDQVGEEGPFIDWHWVLFAAALPVSVAVVVRVTAATRFRPMVQWLWAFAMGLLAVVLVSLTAVGASGAAE
jgi:hypothetical protein